MILVRRVKPSGANLALGSQGYTGNAAARPPHSILELGTEGVFVKTDCRGGAGPVVDGHDVEAARAIADMPLGKEALRGAHHHALLVGGDAEFGERREFFACGSRAYLNKRQSCTVVADEIDFAFGAPGDEVARNKNVAVAAQIPVGVSFTANAGAARGVLAMIVVIIAEAIASGPMDHKEDAVREQGHGVLGSGVPVIRIV